MAKRARVLILDDEAAARDTLEQIIRRRLSLEGRPDIRSVATYEDADHLISAAGRAEPKFDAIFLDLADTVTKDAPGVRLIRKMIADGNDHIERTVVLSAYVSMSGEDDWLHDGLTDFPDADDRRRWEVFDVLSKPPDDYVVARVLEHLCNLPRRAPDRATLDFRATRNQLCAFDGIAGVSAPFRLALELALLVAGSDSRVLLLGESGTGKEQFARAIHAVSDRRSHPFIAVNLAAVPDTLWESELFGHEKGAFTGSVAARKGKFELANGGTLFLDEVGDMSPPMQPKLLRVLEEGNVPRVGAEKGTKVDVRIIAATDKSLQALRRDLDDALYWRLAEATISLPPLKERFVEGDEFETVLLHELMRIYNERHPTRTKDKQYPDFSVNRNEPLSVGARKLLQEHSWPGNYRTFRATLNTIARRLGSRAQITTVDVLDALATLPPHASTTTSDAQSAGEASQSSSRPMASAGAALLKQVCAEVRAEKLWSDPDLKDVILGRAAFRVLEAMIAEDKPAEVAKKYRFGADKRGTDLLRKRKERLRKEARLPPD